jgi:hypothetical protein
VAVECQVAWAEWVVWVVWAEWECNTATKSDYNKKNYKI